jgi:hypothetical protein
MQCADFDGDGRLDIFQAASRTSSEGSSADSVHILRNATPSTAGADVKLEHVAGDQVGVLAKHEPGSDWTESEESVAVLDMNNDGLPDVFLDGAAAQGSRGRLLQNVSTFAPNTPKLSFVESGMPGIDRAAGIASADFDRDGDIDLIVGRSCYHLGAAEECDSEQVHYLENKLETTPDVARNWVQLKLVGLGGANQSNKAAIGARVSISIGGRSLVQEVGGGHGTFGAQSDLVLHFGVGAAAPEIVVKVTWPTTRATNREETITLSVNKLHVIEEGAAGKAAKVTSLTFPKPASPTP